MGVNKIKIPNFILQALVLQSLILAPLIVSNATIGKYSAPPKPQNCTRHIHVCFLDPVRKVPNRCVGALSNHYFSPRFSHQNRPTTKFVLTKCHILGADYANLHGGILTKTVFFHALRVKMKAQYEGFSSCTPFSARFDQSFRHFPVLFYPLPELLKNISVILLQKLRTKLKKLRTSF